MQYWIKTDDDNLPVRLYRYHDTTALMEQFVDGTWQRSERLLPEFHGLGGSADYLRLAPTEAMTMISQGAF